jgi:hypothetical protein
MYIDQSVFSPAEVAADLWIAAREKTEQLVEKRGNMQDTLSYRDIYISISFRGTPTKLMTAYDPGVLPSDQCIIVDLNKYRPGADLKRMKEELGVLRVILRMGGPARFVLNDWALTEDSTYRKYYDEAKALGMTVGGYVVYSAGIDQDDYANSEVLLDFVGEIMDGNRFKPDWLIADDEVNTWWEGSRKVTATAYNQVRGIKFLLPKFWSRYHLVPMHYSAQWFMRQTAEYTTEYMTWLDNANNTYEGKTIMNWYAWYLSVIQNSNKQYTKAVDLIEDVPYYTASAINAYLQLGSYSLYDLHQLTSNWVTPFVTNSAGTPIGVDASITRKSETLFFSDLLIDINPTDTSAPSVPQGLTATNITQTSITLSWLPSADNQGVVGYTVFVDNAPVASPTVPNYVLTALPGQTYAISVDAYDQAGNHSYPSPAVTVTVPAVPGQGCKTSLLDLFR